MKRIILNIYAIIFIFFLPFSTQGQNKNSRQEYIEKYQKIAVAEMERTGIPASIKMAQGILESGDGNSELSRKANNHFGIKCHSDWKGKRFFQDDDALNECFRVYKSAEESYIAHSNFLSGRSRYASLFELETTDYKAWANGLKAAGYATNPKYPDLLIKIIEDNKLYELDKKVYLTKTTADGTTVENVKKAKVEKISADGTFYEVFVTKNDVKFILAKGGETANSLAPKFNMRPWQFKKYNNLDVDYQFRKGDIVYLQPKRRKSFEKNHEVMAGENLWSISQRYAIKPQRILKMNGLSDANEIQKGMILRLK